jgi:hypothetical protein
MTSTHHHGMTDLFQQLGLPESKSAIRHFIHCNRPLPAETRLADAPFWTESQATFLRQMLKADSDWAVTIDQLDAALREHPSPDELPSADGDDNPDLQGEGNYVAGKRYDDAAQAFAAQPERVQKAARDAAPRNREEAQEMWEAEAVGLSKAKR